MISISSCKVSKNLAVPNQEILPAQYHQELTKADTNTSMANIPWQSFFSNPELRNLIDSTLRNNFDMQLALKNIEAAQLVARQSKLNYLPELRMQLSGAINRPSDNSLTGLSLGQFLGKSYVEDYSGNLGLSWEADIWGKIRNQRSKALLGYLQTTEAQKAIQTDLVAGVAKGYYRLLMLDAQIRIAKKNLALNDSILQIIRLQFSAGQVTQLAIQQATAQQLAASELLPQLEKEIKLEEHYLSILSGITPGSIKRSGDIDEQLYKGTIQTGFPAALLANRPDVKARELGIQVANANTAIARASMYPSLTIGINGGVNSFLASNWFTMPASLFVTGIAGISQPLFQQGKLKATYEISKIEREKSVIAFRQTVLQAVREVSDALISVEKLMDQKNIAEKRVQTLQRSIQDAKQLFSQGMANYLEVITAQGNVLAGELSVAMLQQQQSAALIDLYRSLGGGWHQ
jgi:NodT family efflux transporter outer membrane factor (OMF) lipoprotein